MTVQTFPLNRSRNGRSCIASSPYSPFATASPIRYATSEFGTNPSFGRSGLVCLAGRTPPPTHLPVSVALSSTGTIQRRLLIRSKQMSAGKLHLELISLVGLIEQVDLNDNEPESK